MVERIEIAERERLWPGTATPGTAVRIRAVAAAGIDTPSLTHWLKEALSECKLKMPEVAITAMVAEAKTGLSTMNVSLAFPLDQDPTHSLSSRTINGFLDGALMDPATLTADLFTEHRIAPNPQTWT